MTVSPHIKLVPTVMTSNAVFESSSRLGTHLPMMSVAGKPKGTNMRPSSAPHHGGGPPTSPAMAAPKDITIKTQCAVATASVRSTALTIPQS